MSAMFHKHRKVVGKLFRHYRVGYGSVSCLPLFSLVLF